MSATELLALALLAPLGLAAVVYVGVGAWALLVRRKDRDDDDTNFPSTGAVYGLA